MSRITEPEWMWKRWLDFWKIIHPDIRFLCRGSCQLIEEEVSKKAGYSRKTAWTREGFLDAVRMLLSERNTLFESLSEKLTSYPELNQMLYSLLFTGKAIVYNYYEPSINIATMFGLVKNRDGVLAVANRIFETWLYNLYLSAADMQKKDIYAVSLLEKESIYCGRPFEYAPCP